MTTQAQEIRAEDERIRRNQHNAPTSVSVSDTLFDISRTVGGCKGVEIENLGICVAGAAQMGHELTAAEVVRVFQRLAAILGWRLE